MFKKFEELNFSDDFMFSKVMEKQDLCKELLELILGIRIKNITYPEREKTIGITGMTKSIRLDVYTENDEGVYDIEMQVSDRKDLPKRSRYYQGVIDLNMIRKGSPYNSLKKSFVIFICLFDPFGKERYVYTFENVCREDTELILGDEAVRIFLNTKGRSVNISEKLKGFLEYVNGNVTQDSFTERIENETQKVRSSDEWRREYMTLYMKMQEEREDARAEGRAEGLAEGRAEGLVEGQAEMIIRILQKKSISSNTLFQYIRSQNDEKILDDLFDRAFAAQSIHDLSDLIQ